MGGYESRKCDLLNSKPWMLLAQHKANPVSRLLAEIPGVGPITAIYGIVSGAPGPLRVMHLNQTFT